MRMNKFNKVVKWAIIFLFLSGFVTSASAFDASQIQWGENISFKHLQRGEVVSYMGYSVKVSFFPPPVESDKYKDTPSESVEPFVGLNISKNGSFVDTIVLGPGESYIGTDGELKITVNELPPQSGTEWLFESYNPWVTLDLNPRGEPVLGLAIDTDSTKYSTSDKEIVASITLENTGLADAVNVDLVLDSKLPLKKGNLKYHYNRVKKGDSITETVTFSLPILDEQQTFDILGKAEGLDVMEIPYAVETVKKIPIDVEPEQSLYIKKNIANAKIYLKDYTMISISLKNNGDYPIKNISIKDSLPASFKLVGNNSLQWLADIPPNEEWDFRYLIKPIEPNKNSIIFPAATAEYTLKNEYYSIQSSQPTIVVYGPKIVLVKQTDVSNINPGDTVTVTVVAENIGSTPTTVFIKDILPDNTTLVSGTITHEEFLEASKEVSFSYSFRSDSDKPVKLPPATADYYELGTKGVKISTVTKETEIGVKSPIYDETIIENPEIQPSPPAEIISIIESPDNNSNSSIINSSLESNSHEDTFWTYILVITTLITTTFGILLLNYYTHIHRKL